jgi:tryptophan halogenase
VLHGQRVQAAGHHPLADLLDEKEITEYLGDIASVVGSCVNQMPSHAAYIAARCASR